MKNKCLFYIFKKYLYLGFVYFINKILYFIKHYKAKNIINYKQQNNIYNNLF